MNYFQFIGPAVLSIFALGFLVVNRTFPSLKSTIWFGLSYASLSIALTLDFLRDNFSPVMATYMTNIPYLTTSICFATGVRLLHNQPAALSRSLTIAGIAFVLLVYFRHFDLSIVARTVVVTCAVPAIIMLALWDGRTTKKGSLIKAFGWLMVTVCTLSVVRTGIALAYENSVLTTSNYLQSATAIALQVSTSISAVAAAILLFLIYGWKVTLLLRAESDAKQSTLTAQFGQFLSPAVVRRLTASSETIDLSVDKQTISILLVDMRGFTAFSDRHGSDAAAARANRFFSLVGDVILEHEGTIDKYLGDAVLAFWNAPFEQENHADRAIIAAKEIQKRLVEDTVHGQEPIEAVTIVETGMCSVGNFGTAQRLDYTAIGPPVNMVSRLEAEAKRRNMAILIGPGAASQTSYSLTNIESVFIRGYDTQVTLFAPASLSAGGIVS